MNIVFLQAIKYQSYISHELSLGPAAPEAKIAFANQPVILYISTAK
jgi:hypothetical protein